MQVRPGRAAGIAREGYALRALHYVALLDEELGEMRVAGDEVVAVIEVDHVAVLRMKAGELDDPAGRGNHRRAEVGKEIDPLMHRPLSTEGIDPPAKAGGVERCADRREGRGELLLHSLLEELRLEHAHHIVAGLDLARQQRELVAE